MCDGFVYQPDRNLSQTKISVLLTFHYICFMENDNKEPEGLQTTQRLIIDLSLGAREPQNDYERQLLKEIEEIKEKGHMLDLPFE